jgi:hypothetical protein
MLFNGIVLTMIFDFPFIFSLRTYKDKAKAIGIASSFGFVSLIHDSFLVCLRFQRLPIGKINTGFIALNLVDLARVSHYNFDISALSGCGCIYKEFFESSLGMIF